MILSIKYYLRRRIIFKILQSISFYKKKIIVLSGISYILKRKRSSFVPYIITLRLTSDCNFSCIMCEKSSMDDTIYTTPVHMDFDKLSLLLRKYSKYIVLLKLHGGEPLLYSNIIELLKLLNQLNIKFSLITNGSLLTEDICQLLMVNCIELEISIDSVDEKLYKKIRRGGDFNLLRNNIKRINRFKEEFKQKQPYLRMVVSVFNFNIRELKGTIDFAKTESIDEVVVLEGTFYNTKYINEEDFIKINLGLVRNVVKEVSDYAKTIDVLVNFKSNIFKSENDKEMLRKKRVQRCFYYYSMIDVAPNFDVSLCAVSECIYNLNKNSLHELWNSNNSKIVKNRLLLNKNIYPDTCRYCKQFYMKNYKSYIDYQKEHRYWIVK